jgi:hypothetical protein
LFLRLKSRRAAEKIENYPRFFSSAATNLADLKLVLQSFKELKGKKYYLQ